MMQNMYIHTYIFYTNIYLYITIHTYFIQIYMYTHKYFGGFKTVFLWVALNVLELTL